MDIKGNVCMLIVHRMQSPSRPPHMPATLHLMYTVRDKQSDRERERVRGENDKGRESNLIA